MYLFTLGGRECVAGPVVSYNQHNAATPVAMAVTEPKNKEIRVK